MPLFVNHHETGKSICPANCSKSGIREAGDIISSMEDIDESWRYSENNPILDFNCFFFNTINRLKILH